MGYLVRLLTFAVVITLLLLPAACKPKAGPDEPPGATADRDPAPGGTVVLGTINDVQSWNPYLCTDFRSATLLSLIYPSLAIEQVDYRDHPPSFEPSLATAWKFSEDHLTLDFELRRGARWSDGVAVTAADVVFSYKTQISPEIAWTDSSAKSNIERVEAVDEHTVRFVFSRRYPYQLMDAVEGQIIPAHAWSKIPFGQWRDTDWKAAALCAGPFCLSSHTPQQEIVLERNQQYWVADRPYLDRVVWRVVPDQNNLLTQLKTGEVDWMGGIPTREATRIIDNPSLELISFPDRGYTFIGWNNQNPILENPKVRQALTMAIDRQAIIDGVRRGFANPSTGPVLSAMWAFNSQLTDFPFDPDRARALLAEEGWKDEDGDGIREKAGQPFEIELFANSETQERQDIAMLVRDNLAQVGIRVNPRFLRWGVLLAKCDTGDFDAFINRWVEPTQVDLSAVWHTARADDVGFNWVRFSNAEVDGLIKEVDVAPDCATQKPLVDRMQEIIVNQQPYTFLYENFRLHGLNTRVHGAVLNDATPYFNLEQWYVNTAAQ